MYTLASFLGAAAFAWQAWGLVRCKGFDVRHVRFGVPWSPPLCCCFCMAGMGLGARKGLDVQSAVRSLFRAAVHAGLAYIVFGVAAPFPDARIIARCCLPCMRVWRLAVCKLRSGVAVPCRGAKFCVDVCLFLVCGMRVCRLAARK